MTPLDTIRQYCKANNIGSRKLAKAVSISVQQAENFLEGHDPKYTVGKIIESWYNLQIAAKK